MKLYLSGTYYDVRYSNGGMNTGLNLVPYSKGIQIPDHLVIDQKTFDHSNARLVQYSDPHCTLKPL